MSRPKEDRLAPSQKGDVHLGFWSLWAAPEGFAGYDGCGNLQPMRPHRLLLKVQEALKAREKEKDTEILVVGHSLGGAVSW